MGEDESHHVVHRRRRGTCWLWSHGFSHMLAPSRYCSRVSNTVWLLEFAVLVSQLNLHLGDIFNAAIVMTAVMWEEAAPQSPQLALPAPGALSHSLPAEWGHQCTLRAQGHSRSTYSQVPHQHQMEQEDENKVCWCLLRSQDLLKVKTRVLSLFALPSAVVYLFHEI